MTQSADPRPHRKRILLLAGTTILLAILVAGYLVAAQRTPARAHDQDFRFDDVYIGTLDGKIPQNTTTLHVDAWFTNTGTASMRRVELFAVAIETGRNLAVHRLQRSLGELAGRHTMNASWDMPLNASNGYRLEILVLMDGLLIAKGQGSVGFTGYYDGAASLDSDSAYRVSAAASDFTYTYPGTR